MGNAALLYEKEEKQDLRFQNGSFSSTLFIISGKIKAL